MSPNVLIPFIIVAARSGGHIIPAITLAQQRDHERNIVAITSDAALDAAIVHTSPAVMRHETVPFTSAPVHWYEYPLAAIYFVWSIVCCAILFWQINPPMIFSTGGAIAVPAAIAARIVGIPFELYELNAVPGRATRQAARCATKVYVVFPQAGAALGAIPVTSTQYPLSYDVQSRMSQSAARKELGINAAQKVIMILGGSQGSQHLNALAYEAIAHAAPDAYVLHQAGPEAGIYQQKYAQDSISARVVSFEKDLSRWYAAADCAIARAGSGTIHELLFFDVPTILVPLVTHSTDHQADNARAIQRMHPKMVDILEEHEGVQSLAELLRDRLLQRVHNHVPERERAL